ncbi:MAG: TIGR02270 family protein [Amaricoccus sp.]
MHAPVIAPIVAQHAEDAAFLWLLRDRAADGPQVRLRDLARLDERVEAHLDGLRVAGAVGWRLAADGLDRYGEPGETFAAAVLALGTGDPARLEPVLERAAAEPACRRAVVAALGWVGPAPLRPLIGAWLADPRPERRWLAAAACSVHRIDPGPHLPRLLGDAPPVRARALRLAGELGRADLLPAVMRALADPGTGFWAAWAGTLLGDRGPALAALRAEVESRGPEQGRALRLVLRAMDPASGRRWLHGLPNDPGKDRLAVEGAGILGDPALVPWLIERMRDPALARLAGESVAMLTGIELSGALATSGEDGDPAPRDADLPWPNPDAVAAWWAAQRLPPGTRLLAGQPAAGAALAGLLATGFQRQRRAAALQHALARPETPLFNCAARAPLQEVRARA